MSTLLARHGKPNKVRNKKTRQRRLNRPCYKYQRI